MMFSSGAQEKVNADPMPWLYDGFRATESMAKSQSKWSTVWRDPRPEFDRPLTNPANLILREWRSAIADGLDFTEPADVLARLEDMTPGSDAWFWRDRNPAALEHAERVLSRLARLT